MVQQKGRVLFYKYQFCFKSWPQKSSFGILATDSTGNIQQEMAMVREGVRDATGLALEAV